MSKSSPYRQTIDALEAMAENPAADALDADLRRVARGEPLLAIGKLRMPGRPSLALAYARAGAFYLDNRPIATRPEHVVARLRAEAGPRGGFLRLRASALKEHVAVADLLAAWRKHG